MTHSQNVVDCFYDFLFFFQSMKIHNHARKFFFLVHQLLARKLFLVRKFFFLAREVLTNNDKNVKLEITSI